VFLTVIVTSVVFLHNSSLVVQWRAAASTILARQRYYDAAPSSSPRLCCLIVTAPQYLPTRAKAVNDTWGPRCDRYFFVSEFPRASMTREQIRIADRLPIAPIPNITSGYDHLTQKSTLALLFAYEHHRNACDWFVKADDDTYLIVDHLRTFLSKQNASEPVTFGYNFKVTMMEPFVCDTSGRLD
jgi:glycoprotein-N-acetylgalactosamine 3-beta-galactosyltransferase